MYDVWMIQDLQPEDDSSHDMTPDTVHCSAAGAGCHTRTGKRNPLGCRRQPVAGGAVARGAADRLRSAGPRRCQQPGATAHSRGAAAAYYLKVGHARPRPLPASGPAGGLQVPAGRCPKWGNVESWRWERERALHHPRQLRDKLVLTYKLVPSHKNYCGPATPLSKSTQQQQGGHR